MSTRAITIFAPAPIPSCNQAVAFWSPIVKLRIRKLLKRDGDRCRWCGIRLVIDGPVAGSDTLTVEHLIPRSAGGTDALENLALACGRCNRRRGPTPVEEWKASAYLARRRLEVAG